MLVKASIRDVWARPLPKPIQTSTTTFVTLRDARNFIVELSDVQKRNEHWRCAAMALHIAIEPDATDKDVANFAQWFKTGLVWSRLIRINPKTGKVEPI